MATSMVRVKEETRAALLKLARQEKATMQDVLARAVEEYRRKRILDATNAAYAALREDKEAWQLEQEERDVWDVTLMDGIE